MNLGFSYNFLKNSALVEISIIQGRIIKNPPNIANQDNSIPTTLMAMANTMPLSVLDENKYNAAGNEYIYSRFMNRTNPYWVLAEQFHNIKQRQNFWKRFCQIQYSSLVVVQGRFGRII